MKEKKWVQHISGQGEKWEVVQEWSDGRNVRRVRDGLVYLFPIDEYVECSPPEPNYTYKNVSNECKAVVDLENGKTWCFYHNGIRVTQPEYKICKGRHVYFDGDIFIIEKRQP